MDYYHKVLLKTVKQKIPFIIHWELTYNCNLKCRHCYVVPEQERPELNTKEIKRFLSALARARALFLIWSGGEPFCREDFLELSRFARGLGFAQRIFTNGTLLSREIIKEIKKVHPLSVEISLYGINPATHDKITGVKGAFKKSFQALFALKKEGINIALKFMLFKENLTEFKQVEKLSKELKAKFVYDFNIAPRQDGALEPIKYRLNDSDLEQFLRNRPVKFKDISLQYSHSKAQIFCNAGVNNLSISPYGDVFPCVGIREKIGSMLEDSIKKLQTAPLLEKLRKRKPFYLKECRNCDLIPYCSRCYGMAQLEDGDLWGKSSEACRTAKIFKKVVEEKRKNKITTETQKARRKK